MHRIHGNHNQNVHDIVRVQIVIQTSGKPFFRNMHRSNCSTKYWNSILRGSKEKQLLHVSISSAEFSSWSKRNAKLASIGIKQLQSQHEKESHRIMFQLLDFRRAGKPDNIVSVIDDVNSKKLGELPCLITDRIAAHQYVAKFSRSFYA